MMRINPDSGRYIALDLLQASNSFTVITCLMENHMKCFFTPVDDLKVISTPITTMREWISAYHELNRQFIPYLAKKKREHEGKEYNEQLLTGFSDVLLARMGESICQVINQQLQHWKKLGALDKKRNQLVINNPQQIIDDADLSIAVILTLK